MQFGTGSGPLSALSCRDDVTCCSSAKMQLVTGWTHMGGEGGGVHGGRGEGENEVDKQDD